MIAPDVHMKCNYGAAYLLYAKLIPKYIYTVRWNVIYGSQGSWAITPISQGDDWEWLTTDILCL